MEQLYYQPSKRVPTSWRAKSPKVAAVLLAAAAAALAPSARALADGTLVHEYSFNDNTGTNGAATDSIGTAHGTLVNSANNTGNQLVTAGGGSGSAGTSPAASLPVAAVTGITSDFSIESFFTASNTNAGFGTLFNFSNAANTSYFLATPNRSNSTGVSSIAAKFNNGAELLVQGPNLNNGAQHQFLTTYTKSNATLRLYVDGLLIGSGTLANGTAFDLTQLTNREGINGLAGFGDQGMNGSTNEFRMYTGVVTPGHALLNLTVGPDVVAATANSFGSSNGDFTDSSNWSLGRVPDATQGDQAIISNGGTANIATSAAFPNNAQLKITSGAVVVSGAGTTFTPAGGIDLAPGSSGSAAVTVSSGAILITPGLFVDADVTTTGTGAKSVTLDAGTLQATGPITLGGTNATFTLGSGGGTINTNGNAVTLNVPVNGTGGLTKTGTGTLTLAGAGSYTGATLVQNGTLSFAAGAIPAGSNLTLGSATSATLQWATGNTTDITSGRTVTLAGTAGSTAIGAFLDTNGNNVTLSGNIAGTNAGQLTKIGAGTLTLQGTANPTSLFVKAGTLALDGAAAQVTTTNFISIGPANGDNGTLILRNGSKLTVPGDFNVSDLTVSKGSLFVQDSGTTLAIRTLYVGKSGASIGAMNQSGGTVGPNAAPLNDWRIGGGGTNNADAGVVGTYDLNSGAFSTPQNFQIGANGKGQFNQLGGTVNVTGGFNSVGRFATGIGQLNVSGGTYTFTPTASALSASEQGTGSINVYGAGTLTTAATAGLSLSLNGGTGQVNLGTGGTIGAKLVSQGTVANSSGTFNFHGGTLKATSATTTFMQGLTNAYVWSEGGTIDTNGNNITVAQNLLAPPAGNGVGSVSVTGGGTGYVTAPMVQVARGTGDTTGVGAVGVATISNGVVTGVTITNPGTGYTAAPTVTLLGGNPATAASGVTGLLAATASGGLTKAGAGILTLSGVNTYTGTTTVNAGTLLVNGSLAGGATANGGTIGGSGTINGPLTITSGSVSPGNSPGIINSGALSLAAGSNAVMELNGTTAGTGYDRINVTGSVTLGGANLQVTVGYAPAIGDTFLLINNDGIDAVSGTFATANGGPIVGNSFTANGDTFLVNYAGATGGADGNDVTLTVTAVPEPATIGAIGLAALGLLARRRRRGV